MKKILLLLLVVSNYGFAACHTMSPAGSGNHSGSDWANTMVAWNTAGLVRGDTYYLANGTYPAVSMTGPTPHSGGAVITFKKARDLGDHGQSCGVGGNWNAAFGAQATINSQFEVLDDGWALDGQDNTTGTGCQIDTKSCYGIFVDGTSCTGSNVACYNVDTKDGANFTLRYVYIQGSSPANNNTSCNNSQTCATDDNLRFVSFGGNGSGCNNVTIQHVVVFNSSHNSLTIDGCANMLIENSLFWINAAGSFYHGQSFNIVDGGNDNMTIRYNIFRDITGTAVIVNLAAGGGTNNGINIYGNVFTAESTWSPTGAPCENGIYACINNIVCNDVKFYNNTINNYQNGAFACGVNYLNTATVQSGHVAAVQNNLWYGTPTAGVALACSAGATCTQDHNSFLSSGTGSSGTANVINQSATCPLSNCTAWTSNGMAQFAPTADVANINNGVTLASPFNLDPLGVTRVIGDWTRGAVQFNSGVQSIIPMQILGTTTITGGGVIR